MSELTAAQEREYVESKWMGVTIEYNNCGMANSYWSVTTQDGTELAHIYSGALCGNGPAIHAAFLFTQERERQIAELEEQIKVQKLVITEGDCGESDCGCVDALKRTLALLQRELEHVARLSAPVSEEPIAISFLIPSKEESKLIQQEAEQEAE